MKSIITKTSILLLTIAALIGCNNSGSSTGDKPDSIRRDTTQVLALYVDAVEKKVKWDMLPRVVADSFTFVDVDTLTKKKQWTKDTFYIIGYRTLVDTFIARQYKVPMFDSSRKQNYVTLLVNTEKKYVRSGWNGVDSFLTKEMLSQK